MTDKVWPCEHFAEYLKSFMDDKRLNYCPLCGARRPEELKTLVSRMRNVLWDHASGNILTDDQYKWMAEEAVRAFEEVIDGAEKILMVNQEFCVDIKEIKQKLRELIR